MTSGTVPTATFRILYVLLVMSHDRRRIIHVSVTDAPSSAWTGHQLREASPFDNAPRFLLRDNDTKFLGDFAHCVNSIGTEQVTTAPHSPWQNAHCERLIGSIRRECTDHVIILNERHLRRVLRSYAEYYQESRTHRSPADDSPIPRSIEPPELGEVIPLPKVGGLHHRYTRHAA